MGTKINISDFCLTNSFLGSQRFWEQMGSALVGVGQSVSSAGYCQRKGTLPRPWIQSRVQTCSGFSPSSARLQVPQRSLQKQSCLSNWIYQTEFTQTQFTHLNMHFSSSLVLSAFILIKKDGWFHIKCAFQLLKRPSSCTQLKSLSSA